MGQLCPKKKGKIPLISKSECQIEIQSETTFVNLSHYNNSQLTSEQYGFEQINIQTADGNILPTSRKKISSSDFTFLKVLGRGSFGKVMLVEKKDTRKLYAMKILKKAEIKRRNQQVHTQQERKIIQNNNSPFIVQLHYAFQTKEKLYLVMDFMRGGELFFHLKQSYKFSEKRAKFFIAELIMALESLHKNKTIYRDLKPENVLLDENGHIKLADFGLSKEGIENGTTTDTFCGTPEYLAPEILRRQGHDKSVDWWALGCLLYEMLVGSPPHYSQNQKQMLKNIATKPTPMKSSFSPQARDFLTNLLKINPKQRLGYSEKDAEELKQHEFFREIDWEKLAQKQIEPPIKPKLTNLRDVRNFDKEFTQEPISDTPLQQRMMTESTQFQDHYQNFTYHPQTQQSHNQWI